MIRSALIIPSKFVISMPHPAKQFAYLLGIPPTNVLIIAQERHILTGTAEKQTDCDLKGIS